MNLKKLTVTGSRKAAIESAVTKAMALQPEHMHGIYESILSAVQAPSGRTLLIPSQVRVLVHSMRSCGDGSPDCKAVLDQMTMTRREYQAAYQTA